MTNIANSAQPEATQPTRLLGIAGVGLAALMMLFPVLPLVTRLMSRALHLPAPVVLGVGMGKDLLLAGLLLATLWLWWKGEVRFRWRPVWIALALYAGWLTVYLLLAPNHVLAAYAYRGDLEPLALLVVASLLPLSREQWRKVLWGIFAVAVLVAIFGLYQALVLHYPFLHRYFTNSKGRIPSAYLAFRFGFPRATSTMTTPNQLGFYLTTIILVSLNLAIHLAGQRRWVYLAISGACSIGLLFTLSRSAWLALALGLLVSFVFAPQKRLLAIGVGVSLLLILPIAWRFHLTDRIVDTITLRDPSARGKMPSILQGVAVVQAHPQGVGLGTVGSRTERFGDAMQLHSESYYVQLAMELGIPGLILYLLFVFAIVATLFGVCRNVTDVGRQALPVAALAAVIGVSAGVMFIPALQDIAVASYLWFFAGLGIQIGEQTEENA